MDEKTEKTAHTGTHNYPGPGSYPTQPQWMAPAPYSAPMMMPVAPEPTAPPKRKGFGYGFGMGSGIGIGFGTIIVIGMLFSTLVFGGLVASVASTPSTATPYQTIWGEVTAPNIVRALHISGTIVADSSDGTTELGGTYGYEIADEIDSIQTEDAAGLVLLLNTPGGSINGSWAIAEAVDRYKERTGKKVVAIVQGMSASGGMIAMAGADQIIADHGSTVGSIGVIMGPIEYYDQVMGIDGGLLGGGVTTAGGITQEYITAGQGKDAGNPFRKLTEAERAMFADLIIEDYDKFVAHVAQNRDISENVIRDDLGAGIFSGETAIKHGLIDEIMGRDAAFRAAATTMEVDPEQTQFVAPALPGFIDLLLGAESRIKGQAPALSSDAKLHLSTALCGSSPRVVAIYGNPAGVCR